MTKEEVLDFLRDHSSKTFQNIFDNHGAAGSSYGVKIEYLKQLQKKIKKNHHLSLQLFETGISDAMYLAGLIADETKISKMDIQHWVETAAWPMISEYTVPWIAAESPYGWELALDWIKSDKESIASAGWATLSNLVALVPDEKLDKDLLRSLLNEIPGSIHQSPNRVRYTMNGFVISVGGYVSDLTEKAKSIAEEVGKVKVDMGKTACKVPDAVPYIDKMLSRGVKKKKSVRC